MKQSSLDLRTEYQEDPQAGASGPDGSGCSLGCWSNSSPPYYPEGKNGRPPFALETMLRIHCMQQWFTLSDLAMEEASLTPRSTGFAQLDAHGRMPDESTILRFRHRLENTNWPIRFWPPSMNCWQPRACCSGGHSRGCHLDCSTEFHQEQGTKSDPEMHSSQRATSGTLA
jgi:IS5 family transposase